MSKSLIRRKEWAVVTFIKEISGQLVTRDFWMVFAKEALFAIVKGFLASFGSVLTYYGTTKINGVSGPSSTSTADVFGPRPQPQQYTPSYSTSSYHPSSFPPVSTDNRFPGFKP